MIFLTVGTQFPFDRLVRKIDELCDEGLIDDEVFAQVGDTDYRPRNFNFTNSIMKSEFDKVLAQASHIISHAGMGTISLAFEANKPLLVMPRLKRYGEVVNDHQVSLAKTFNDVGYLVGVEDESQMAEGIMRLKTFLPRPRQNQSYAVIRRITKFLESEVGTPSLFAGEMADTNAKSR
jgi:UDP-N-acetylglucosamine transferase subunit ALG13